MHLWFGESVDIGQGSPMTTFPDGKRKPPTIDLAATEVETRPVADPPASEAAVAAAAEPAPGPASEPAPEPAPEAAHASRETSQPSPAAAPAASPASSAPPAPAPRPRRSAGALIGAGIVGGAVAAGALIAANLYLARDTDMTGLQARLAALELQAQDASGRPSLGGGDPHALDDIAARLAKLEAAAANPRPAPLDLATANRISALEGQLKAIGETVGILGRRNDEIAAIAGEARARAEATAAALAELAQKVARAPVPTVQKNDLDAVSNRLAAVERQEKALEAEMAKRPQADDRAGRLAIVAAALRSAVERGQPFAPELAAAKALGADAKSLTPLEPFADSGLPNATALAREISDLAPALLQAAGGAPREGGFLERLQSNAEKLVRIRRIEDVAGSDPAAIIARVEVKAAHADLAGALNELATLPEAVRAPAAAWIGKAQARAAAVDASRRLAVDALTQLGK
jgi:hypothetical protein